ncbi:MAG: type II toxin-antitoxin system HicB family antitoxin [Rhodospirillales bacterium]
MLYAYPCILKPEKDKKYKGWFNVSFPDVPEALTCAEGVQESLGMAQDALTGALAWYVQERREIPEPGKPRKGQYLVALPPVVAAKLALYRAMRAQKVTNVALAKQLGVTESAVRKLVDPDHRSHIGKVQHALELLGRTLFIEDRAA